MYTVAFLLYNGKVHILFLFKYCQLMKKLEGDIVQWEDARGFGFIHHPASGRRVFFHVSEYRSHSAARPKIGLKVTFRVKKDEKGRFNAIRVMPFGDAAADTKRAGGWWPDYTIGSLYLLIPFVLTLLGSMHVVAFKIWLSQ